MTDDRREEEDATPAEDGHMVRLRRFLAAGMLRPIDAAMGFLQHSRDRIEAPISEEDSRDGRKRSPAHGSEAAMPQVVVIHEPGRLRRFLVFMLALLIGGITGSAYSYRLLSASINSKETVIEYLRDQITQLEKEGARNLDEMARYQRKFSENDKRIIEYRDEIGDYKKQVEELRNELSAIKNVRGEPLAQGSRGSPAIAARGKRPTQEKTGTCTMGSANAAANVAHCVEEFNRR